MTINTPLSELKGVGPQLSAKLSQLGLSDIHSLITYYPRRYDDFSKLVPIAKLQPGVVTVKARIKSVAGRYVRRGLHITEALAEDEKAAVRLVWFNQPYRAAQFKDGQEYYISGEYQLSNRRFSILNPAAELVSDFPINTARIRPVYRETKGLKSAQLRKLIREVAPLIKALPEYLPSWLITELKLISRADAVMAVHFPPSSRDLQTAQQRLGFDEVFELTLAALLNKYELHKEQTTQLPFHEETARQFVAKLPFALTDDQRRVIWQIYQDMEKPQPMNRLIEGDVGSGKTVVAVMAALMALEAGTQVALMAPTEVLARQHYKTIAGLLRPLGKQNEVGLLVGSLKPAEKSHIHADLADNKLRFIIGTHALIADKAAMHNLGLVIIDEQHRFGVEERKKLVAKAGRAPHVLHMTATPIPRSLALTLYGDLDISLLRQKPAGRLPIITELVPPSSRPRLLEKLGSELDKGRQLYVICPLIDESDVLVARSAQETFAALSKGPFKRFKSALLHGKLPANEKEAIMADFAAGNIDVLVSTTVIEVGVDVPNATMMMIESPERFGLAQIHQLRGRVGRSDLQSHCYLMLSDASTPNRRLRALEQSSDGFKLAELDLQLRGPGAIYGRFQHGALDLRFTNLSDTRLISQARAKAQEFIDRGDNLVNYLELYERVQKLRSVTNLN